MEIIKNKTGFVVPSKNSEALADAIIKILSDKKLAIAFGKNARKLVEDNYCWESAAQKTIEVYSKVMGK